MRIGEIESDIDYRHDKANKWGIWTTGALTSEGKKILKKYPDYKILKDDWMVENDDEFLYYTVTRYIPFEVYFLMVSKSDRITPQQMFFSII